MKGLPISKSLMSRLYIFKRANDFKIFILPGFMLLKEALDQALKDKMKTEDQEKYKREMKEIPFTSLLKQVLGQDKDVDKVRELSVCTFPFPMWERSTASSRCLSDVK